MNLSTAKKKKKKKGKRGKEGKEKKEGGGRRKRDGGCAGQSNGLKLRETGPGD